MVERWRKETHCFNFHEGECTITLKDVAVLTHLPIDGNAVCVSDRAPPDVGGMTGWQHLIHNVLDLRVPVKGSVDVEDRNAPFRKRQVSITWLTREIRNRHDPTQGGIPLTEESSEFEKERYARVYSHRHDRRSILP
ncbi:unnamed protein product [Linum tenue]|uniref:Aminotransferase-like plant mobile domain-containing protein n=1 Tax=Linum tenue TaxID=586396 RepID=A0AAV0HZP1_9ROSI|nr:unnamed protein product [Linum tenue]